MVFPTISIGESFSHPTSMYMRNLMSIDTEEMVRAQPMDAVVVIGGCDKTLPAQIMGAVSADKPAIVVPTGPMVVGHHKGEVLGACTDCRRLWAQHRAGKMDEAEIEVVSGRLAPSVGTCMVMGTASTMACVIEALGFTLPYAAAVPAVHAERVRIAEASGKKAVEMAKAGSPTPRQLFTERALRNALIVLQAIGGSTNGIVHLAAMAGRAGITLDLDAFDALSKQVPVLIDLKPSGDHYMEHFHHAGGVPRLMQELSDILDLDAPSVAGTLRDHVKVAEQVPGQTVIRTRKNPINAQGAMCVLRGNIAPRGAVIKQSAATEKLMTHEGRAVVFENIEDMTLRMDDPNLDVSADDVLVLRNAGPKGAPGMPEAGYLPIPKKLAQQGVKDMVRISDARMSGTAFGTIVLHITPESADGGPLGLVQTGDRIRLDVPKRSIELLVDEAELAKRRVAYKAPQPHEGSDRGYSWLYQQYVTQADEGCDFDFLKSGGRGAG
jgi:dihydroxy-acid dehydratase